MTKVLLISACFLLAWIQTGHCDNNVSVYTVHIGMNQAPKGSSLPTLRYADDDAVKLYQFMSAFSQKSVLSTLMDIDSQQQYSEVMEANVSPTSSDLLHALKELATAMKSDQSQGRQVVLYFTYSGHGERVDNGTRMLLLDSTIDREWLKKNILSLPADVVHLIIDTCYAGGIVDSRGMITEEVDASTTSLPSDTVERAEDNLLQGYPHVGALVSSASESEAYEWSALRSGVFTHELLSGLAGAADVNGDGDIAYSEVAAFISSANRSISHYKAQPKIVSYPPMIDRNLPIISYEWAAGRLSFLEGKSNEFSRFYVETTDGGRLLDAHLEKDVPFRIAVPANQPLWIRTGRTSAVVTLEQGQVVELAMLSFSKNETTARGDSMSNAFHKGLFATRFGPAYYTGWVDSRGEVSVSILGDKRSWVKTTKANEIKILIEGNTSSRRPLPIALFAVSGVAAAGAGVFLGMAIYTKYQFDETEIQRVAHNEKSNYWRYTGLSIGLAVAAVAGLTVGIVQKRRQNRARTISFNPTHFLGSGSLRVSF